MNIGDRVIALVDPQANDGTSEAPGTVTRVHADGTCDVTVLLVDGSARGLSAVTIHGTKADAQEYLTEALVNIPQQQDGHGERRPATIVDVLRWLSVAFQPGAAPAPVDGPTQPEE